MTPCSSSLCMCMSSSSSHLSGGVVICVTHTGRAPGALPLSNSMSLPLPASFHPLPPLACLCAHTHPPLSLIPYINQNRHSNIHWVRLVSLQGIKHFAVIIWRDVVCARSAPDGRAKALAHALCVVWLCFGDCMPARALLHGGRFCAGARCNRF